MSQIVTLIPGDGIGPEVTEAVVRIFKVADVDIEWERHDAGVTAFKRDGQSLPGALLDSIRRHRVALKGPVTTPIAEGFTSVNVGLRKALDLYANLPASRAGLRMSTSSSSARTPRISTPDWSTRSCPAWLRA
jgi:isocitrate dehydrogenase (NAD+)